MMVMRSVTGLLRLAAILLVIGTLPARAEDEAPVTPDAFIYCTVCHGVQLMGNPIIQAPRLSGMSPWYVEQQLNAYKQKIRGAQEGDVLGYEMQPMAEALSAEEIVRATRFVAETRSPTPPATVSGNVNAGKTHYSSCAACHGVDGKGNESLRSPDLTIADDWYLVTQLRNYQSGARGSHHGDIVGNQMRTAARSLADDQAILDVVAYINTLRDK